MSAQDKTEEILRQMHILLAGSEAYDSIGSKIILDKKRMLELLAELNKAIYAMLDEYERMPCRRFIRMPMKNFRKKKML